MKHRKTLFQRIWQYRFNYILVLPFVALIFIFCYVPMYGVTLAFKDFKIREGIMGSPWVGLKYFKQIFNSYSFWEVLRNTVVITLSKLVICFPAPIIFAIFINEIRNDRTKKVFQTISYLPHFLSWVVVGSFVHNILALRGPVNWIINLFGGESIYFMAREEWFRPILIITDIWKGVGWGSIIYLAAITGIDPEQYEAAEVDGATKLQKIWHITLPGIRHTIITLFIMNVGGILSAGFDQVFNLMTPTTMKVGDVLDTYVYRQGLVNANYSYSTAVGLFKNVIGFLLLITTNTVVKKLSDGEEGIW